MAQTRGKASKASSTKKATSKTETPTTAAKKTPPSRETSRSKEAIEDSIVAMVRGLAEIVEARSLTELIVDTPEVTLTLRRSGFGGSLEPTLGIPAVPMAAPVAPIIATPAQTARAAVAAPAVQTQAAPEPVPADNDHVVTSPFVGTFYRRPGPDTVPYVEIGSTVRKGQVLCIVEAMKLMNEIEADVDGTITAVLVDDGKPVEYGQPLFKVRR